FSFFFFQAEDGIRDATVTGVQTCALPICKEKYSDPVTLRSWRLCGGPSFYNARRPAAGPAAVICDNIISAFAGLSHLIPSSRARSEERRVGKECRCGWWRVDCKEIVLTPM